MLKKYRIILSLIIGGLLMALSLALFYSADTGKDFGIKLLSEMNTVILYIVATISLTIGLVLYYIPLYLKVKQKTMM